MQELPFEMEPKAKRQLEKETEDKIHSERKKPKKSKKRKKKHPGRRQLSEHLPVEEIEIYPERDLSEMERIGKEVTETLEYQPARYSIKRYIRYKYARKNKEEILIGDLPERTFPKTIAGSSVITSVLVDKYMDHLPLYRQEQRFKREKIPITSSTLGGWARQGLEKINILYEHLKEETKSKGCLQADETPIKVLDRKKKGKCHRGYYWVYHNPMDGTVFFDYQPSRSGKAARPILGEYEGYLQTDGYDVYESIGKKKAVTHLFCRAHARRKFEKALSDYPEEVELALTFIQALYRTEAETRGEKMKAKQRKELRLEKSLPVLNVFTQWMKDQLIEKKVLPKSLLGKAIANSFKRWDGLNAYLYDGMLEIDNNLIENTIRLVALGRKNYLFAGSHKAAQRAAGIYSFFAMCKKHKVNPSKWLNYVFDNMMDTKMSELHKLYLQNFKN